MTWIVMIEIAGGAVAYLLVGAAMLAVLRKTDMVPGMEDDEVVVGMCMIFWPAALIAAIALGIMYLIGKAFIVLGRAARRLCR